MGFMDNMSELAAQQQERKASGHERRADRMANKHMRGGRRGRKAEARATAAYRKADRFRNPQPLVNPFAKQKSLVVDPSMNSAPDPTRPIGAEPESPPAFWAYDPQGQHRLRWWDGTQWTDHVHD